MEQQAVASTQLPIGFCAVCDRDVLTYVVTIEDDEPRFCVHCDGVIDEDDLRPVTLTDLETTGYAEIQPAKSCGSGGGCSSGGCRR